MSAPAAAVRVIGEFEFDPACKIGAGSFATVYSGRRVSDDMPVAIKVGRTQINADCDYPLPGCGGPQAE